MRLSCSAINIRKFDDHERWAKIEPGLGISSIGIATEMNVNCVNDHVVSSQQINEYQCELSQMNLLLFQAAPSEPWNKRYRNLITSHASMVLFLDVTLRTCPD